MSGIYFEECDPIHHYSDCVLSMEINVCSRSLKNVMFKVHTDGERWFLFWYFYYTNKEFLALLNDFENGMNKKPNISELLTDEKFIKYLELHTVVYYKEIEEPDSMLFSCTVNNPLPIEQNRNHGRDGHSFELSNKITSERRLYWCVIDSSASKIVPFINRCVEIAELDKTDYGIEVKESFTVEYEIERENTETIYYRYYPEGATDSYGCFSVDRTTLEVSLTHLAENDMESVYADHATRSALYLLEIGSNLRKSVTGWGNGSETMMIGDLKLKR